MKSIIHYLRFQVLRNSPFAPHARFWLPGLFLGLTLAGLQAQESAEPEAAALALPTRVQTISLAEGWNAVFLEVDPLQADPDELFKETPVEFAARYFLPVTTAQFISDPESEPWRQPGWGVWYPPTTEQAFLKSLHAIHGGHGYLIRAGRAFEWEVEGAVKLQRYRWQAGAFNLFGFSVDPSAPPSFEQFFAAAGSGAGEKIYRLVDGRWREAAAGATMRPGEACWIYGEGRIDYSGALEVNLSGIDVGDFGRLTETLTVELRNRSDHDITYTVELVEGAGSTSDGEPGLPLALVEFDAANLKSESTPISSPLAPAAVAADSLAQLRIGIDRDALDAAVQTGLLKLTTSEGGITYLPFRAAR